jgi:hypothetical protein
MGADFTEESVVLQERAVRKYHYSVKVLPMFPACFLLDQFAAGRKQEVYK